MVTYSQQMGSGGTAFNEERQGQGPQPSKKKNMPSGKTLFVISLFVVLVSAALPYGLGIAVLVWGIALIGALVGAGFAFVTLLQELLGKGSSFGYAPGTAYMTGKKMKKRKKDETEDSGEEKKHDH